MTITIYDLKRRIDTEVAQIKDKLLFSDSSDELARLQADGRSLIRMKAWIDEKPDSEKQVSSGSGY